MKKVLTTSLALAAILTLSSTVYADSFGTNITIQDMNPVIPSNVWNQLMEDNETEPGMVIAQKWDLEGIFLDGTKLTIVGGFNFMQGQDGYLSGDIFIDVDGDAKYGDIHGTSPDGYKPVSNSFGYDYAIDLNFTDKIFKVYEINTGTLVRTPYFTANYGSGPFERISGGTEITGLPNRLEYGQPTIVENGLGGTFSLTDTHYAMTIDIGFLGASQQFLTTFTMGCGNDNIVGQGVTPAPEPATTALVFLGTAAFAGLARRRRK